MRSARLGLIFWYGAAAAAAVPGPSWTAPPGGVELATTVARAGVPTTVLVHGLDSSKETWRGTLAALAATTPAVALDLRGHGESRLGDPGDFSCDALAEDVIGAVARAGIRKWVLVGHSMGGRVAMRVAAKLAAEEETRAGSSSGLKAVIIEDMDATTRAQSGALDGPSEALIRRFERDDGRRFATFDDAKTALAPFYDAARIEGWRGTRIRERTTPEAASSWWSDINPAAQRLARDRVLATSASDDWATLAEPRPQPVDIHLWVAGTSGTVCAMDGPLGIDDMARRIPRAKTRVFPDASHSIHNTTPEDFINGLLAIVQEHTILD